MKQYITISGILFLFVFVIRASAVNPTLITDPANGHYCQGTSGLVIKIQNSVAGITYKLRRPLTGAGDLATVVGNGGTVTFPGNWTSGTYITVPPTSSVNVIMDPQPTGFAITMSPTNGKFCNYPGAEGVEILMASSQIGIEYELFLGTASQGPAWMGTGAFHSFGHYTIAGTYTVKATDTATGCIRNMGTAIIVSNTPPVAGFTFQVTNPCAANPVTFTKTTPGNNLYKWNFDDPKSGPKNKSNLPNPTHIFEAWGASTETFDVQLLVTDANGCKDSVVHPVTVTQKPDATLTDVLNPPNSSYPNTFASCGANNVNPVGLFEFHNASTTKSTNTNYNITWGTCTTTPTYNSTTFNSNIPVTYTCLGEHVITYTVNGTNGCNNTRIYGAFVGSNPAGGLTTPPNTYGVAPFLLNFIIPDQAYNNTPGTQYIYDFGDGTIDTIYQEDLPASHIMPHTYTTCSQVMIDGMYAFKATCRVNNPCGFITNTAFPINVSCRVNGGFGGWGGGGGTGGGGGGGFGWFPGDTDSSHIVGCNPVNFNNTSIPGFYIYPNGTSYTQNTYYSWNFGDPASGAANTSTSPNPTHTFTNSGQTYTVTLITYTGQSISSNSGIDTVVKYIYIQTDPEADFTYDITDACTPKYVQIEDLSDVGGLGIPAYKWSVIPATGWQIVTPGFENDNTVPEPLFKFTAMGPEPYYRDTIRLELTNSCGVSIKKEPVLVCEPPEVAFQHPTVYYCGPGPRLFAPAYDLNCDSAFVDVLWEITPSAGVTFAQGTSANSYKPIISFPDYNTYQVKVTITNDCGTDNATQTVVITQSITNNIINATPSQFCGCKSPITIVGALPVGGSGVYTYQWEKNTGSGWIQIPVGGTGQNYMITEPLCETTQYRRAAYDEGDCADVSLPLEITIYPSVQNNQIFSDQLVCVGTQADTINGTIAFGGNQPMQYTWEKSTDNGTTWALIPGYTDSYYVPDILTQTTMFRRVATSDPCQPNNSTPVTLSVCAPITNNIISVSSNEVCYGKQPAPLMSQDPLGACGSYFYQWQKSDIPPFTSFTDLSGATGQTYQPYALTSTTHFRRVVTSLSNCDVSYSNVLAITVNPNPTAEAGIYAPIPNGWNISLSGLPSGGTPPYTIHAWTPANQISGNANQQTVTTIPLTVTTPFTYTVTDSKGCTGSDITIISVTGAQLTCNVTANPTSVCPACPNGPSHICANPTGGSGSYTYSWTSVPPFSGPPPTTSCIDVCPTTTTVYTCTVWDGFASCSQTATITVAQVPVISSTLAVSICSGQALNYSPTSQISGTTYTWTTTAGSCSGNNSGQGLTIGDVLFNYSNTPCTVEYQITPHGPGPNYCVGSPVTLAVTVMPVATITNTVSSQVVVSGQMTTAVNFETSVAGANVRWEFFEVSCPGYISSYLTSGTSSILPSQVLSLLPGSPATCYLKYKVTPYLNLPGGVECTGTPYFYNIAINTQPSAYNMICPPAVCAGVPVSVRLDGSDVGIDYQLLRSGVPVAGGMLSGTGDTLTWDITLNGSYTIMGTNITNQQSVLMDGQCQVVVNPNPVSNYLIGSTGNCPGDVITLNGSQAGVLYELFNGNVNTLISRYGPGPLDFGPQQNPGIYKIKATYPMTGCTVWIDGSVLIEPLPLQFAFTPAGPQCAGDQFSLVNSEPGIFYSLICTPTSGPQFTQGPFSGPGPINFGVQVTPGLYKVLAFNPLTGCDILMDDEKVIWPNPVPYNITPSGSYCGLTQIGLDDSEPGFTYRVHKIDPDNGQPYVLPDPQFAVKAGTGGPLVFGSTSVPWTYCVIALDQYNICNTQMNGLVTVMASPTKYQMLPTGTLCYDQTAGIEVRLEHSDLGIEYTLFLDGVPWSAPLPGVGGNNPLSFGFITTSGTFTITARNVVNNCTETMYGTLTLHENPIRYTLNPQAETCPGAQIWLSGSQTGVNYTLHPPAGPLIILPGTGNALSWGQKFQPGFYYVTAQSLVNTCQDTMNGQVRINPSPAVFSVKPQGLNCEPTDIGLQNAEANTTYEIVNQDGASLNPPVTHFAATAGSFWFNSPRPAGSYRVKAITAKGCDTLMNGIVVIDPKPTANAGPPGMTICNMPPYSVDLTGTATNYSSVLWISPTNPSGSNFTNPNSLVTSYTFTPADIANQQVELMLKVFGQNGCASTHVRDSVLIYILATQVNAGPDQQVCAGESIQLTGSVTGGTTSGVWTGGTGTFQPGRQALNAIYIPSPAEAGTTVILTLQSVGAEPCPNLNDPVSLTIYPVFTPGTAGNDQTTCYGQPPVPIAATLPGGGSGNFQYQWQALINGIWNDIAGATSLNYSPPGLITSTSYRIRQTDSHCNPDQVVTSNAVNVTVLTPIAPGQASSPQTICYNETPAALNVTGPTGGSSSYACRWQMKTGSADWVNIPGATALTYSPPSLMQTTMFRAVHTDLFCSPLQEVASNTVTITVYGQLTSGMVTASQSVCYNSIPSTLFVTSPTGGSSLYSYQWQSKSDSGDWTDITGAVAVAYSPPSLTETTHYRVIQKDAFCEPDQSVITNSITITVHGQLVAGQSSGSQTICYGETPNPLIATMPSGGSSQFLFQWQTEIAGQGWTNISGATTSQYAPPALFQTRQYRVVQSDPGCFPMQSVFTEVVTITVYGQLGPGVLSSNQVICNGETPQPLAVTLPTGGSGTFAMTWQSRSGASGWNNIPGATDITYTPIALTATTEFRVKQADTWCTPDQEVTSNVVTVSVHTPLVAGNAGSNQQICQGETPMQISMTSPSGGSGSFTYQWQSQNQAGQWINIPNANSLFFNPPALYQTTIYRLNITDGYCNPAQQLQSNTVTIQVHEPLAPGIVSSDQTICYSETPQILTMQLPTGGSGNYAFQWQSKTGTGNWTDISGMHDLQYTPPALFATTQYRVVQTDLDCNPDQSVNTLPVTITVHGLLSPGTVSSSQTICYSETPQLLTVGQPVGGSSSLAYTWQARTSLGSWNNIPGATADTYQPPALFVTTEYRVIQQDIFCNPPQAVTTSPIVVIVLGQLVSGAVTTDQTICYNETPQQLSMAMPSGGSGTFIYQWQIMVQGGSWNNIPSAISLNYNPPALTQTSHFRAIVTDPFCEPDQQSTSNEVIIQVHPQLQPGVTGADQTICYGDIPALLNSQVPQGGSGNFAYQWQQRSGTGSWTDIPNANSLTFAPPSLFVTTYYRIIQRDLYCNPDQEVAGNQVTITVHGQLTAGTATSDQTICFNQVPAPVQATMPAGGSNSFSYQWQSKTGSGDWSTISGATGLSYAPPALAATTSYRMIISDSWCSPMQTQVTNPVTITVSGTLAAGTVTSDQVVCYGESASPLTITLPAGGSGTFAYQWQSQISGGSWNNIPGANALSYQPISLTQTTSYRVVVSDDFCTPGQQSISNSVTILVYDLLQPGQASVDQSICFGNTPQLLQVTPPSGGSQSFQYQWQNKVGSGSWSDITNANGAIFLPPALTVTTQYRVIQSDISCNPDQSVTSNIVTVTVFDDLVAGLATSDQTICFGEKPLPITAQSPSGGSGQFLYQWQSQSGSGTWNNIPAATGLTYSPPNLSLTTQYRLLQRDTWCFPVKEKYTNPVVVTVHGQFIPGLVSASQSICYGETPAPLSSPAPAGGSGNFSYQWQVQDAGGNWFNIPSAFALTYAPPALTATTKYRLVATDHYCTPAQAVNSNIVTITVYGQLVAGNATQPQQICYGQAPVPLTAVVPTGGSGNFSYQWQSKTGSGTWTNLPGANSLTFNPGNLTATTSYRIMQSDLSCLAIQSVPSNEVLITVFDVLQPGSVSADQAICRGETPDPVSVTLLPGGSGSFSYQWQIQAGSGTWNNIPGATDLTYAPPSLLQTTRYRMLQRDTWCSPVQEVASNAITITVHGLLVPGIVSQDQTICHNEIPGVFSLTLPSGGSGNFTIQWQIESTGGVWTNLPGANAVFYQAPALTTTTRYRAVQTDIFCDPPQIVYTNSISISVYDQLTAGQAGNDQTICYGETPAVLTAVAPSGGSGNFTYNWQVQDGFGTWNNISGATTLTYAPPALTQTTRYRISQTDTYCNPDQRVNSIVITITVHAEYLAGTANSDQITCENETPSPITATPPVGGSGNNLYQWETKTDATGWADVPNATGLSFAPPPLTVTTYYRLKQTDTFCNPDHVRYTNEITITVVPIPVPTLAGSQLVCINSTGNVYTTEANMQNYEWSVVGGNITYGGGYNDNSVTVMWTTLGNGSVSVNYHEGIHNCPAAQPTILQVTVVNPPVPVITTSPPNTTIGCLDQCMTFQTEADMTNYQWLISPGGVICSQGTSSDRGIVVRWTTPGAHWVSVNYTGPAGCAANSPTTYFLNVIPAPTPTINGPNYMCEGGQTALYATETGMTGYQWTVSSGGTIAGGQGTNQVMILWNTTGTHTVQVAYTNYFGCVTVVPTSYTVTVAPVPIPSVNGPATVCVGAQGNIYTTDQGNSNYQWTISPGGNITSGGGPNDHSVTVQWNTTGYQSVTVTYEGAYGCDPVFPATLNVFVQPSPVPAVYGPASVCQSDYTVAYSTQSGMTGYTWSISPGGQIINGTGTSTIQVQWVATGSQSVSVNYTNTNGCQGANPTVFNVTVGTRPVASFQADTVCLGTPTSFTNASTSPGTPIVNYFWEFGDGQTSGAQHPVHLYASTGSYPVKLTVTNSAGCIKDTTKMVFVWAKPTALFSSSINNCAGDSVQFTDYSSTGHGYITQWNWDFGDGSTPVVVNFPGNPNIKHKYGNGGNYNVILTITTSDGCQALKSNLVSVGFKPLANFTTSLNNCAMLATQFTDLSQLNGGPPITAWSWDFGEPSTGTANYSTFQNPTHVYQSQGPFTAILTITNANGCIDTISKAVAVNPVPYAKFEFDSSCVQAPTHFSDLSTPAGAIVAWSWNFGDPASGTSNTSTLQNPEHTYNTPGTYWITLQVTNANQCVNDTSMMLITNPSPIADFQYSAACDHSTTHFTDLSLAPNSTIKSWLWDFGDGGSANIANPEYIYTTPGTYQVKLIVTNLFNCVDSVVKPVVVRYKPTAAFNYISSYCPAGEVDFQDSSQALGGAYIENWHWIFEPGFSSNSINPSYTFNTTDTSYAVTLMVEDNFGCRDSVIDTIDVKPGFSLSMIHDTVCFGALTHFQAINEAEGDSMYSVSWNFGDPASGLNNTSASEEPTHQFTATGNFIVWLKAYNSDNCVDSVFRIVEVKRLAEPAFSHQVRPCNDTVVFTDHSNAGTGTITSWKWLWGDGSPSLLISPPWDGDTIHVFSEEKTYNVRLIVTNSRGCSDTVSENVTTACITASFTKSGTFNCSGDSVTFFDQSTPLNKIDTWHWDFGDGQTLDYTAYRTAVSHKFQPGTYLVTLTTGHASGTTSIESEYSMTVTVTAGPDAAFSFSAVCAGDSTRFLDLSVDNQVPITSRTWRFGDGTIQTFTDSKDPVHLYSKAGIYTCVLILQNSTGCKDSVFRSVRVLKHPKAMFSSSPPCQRYDMEFTDNSTSGDTVISRWWWNMGDPLNPLDTLYGESVTYRYDSPGTYPVYLMVADKNGCIDDTLATTFEVKQSPVAAFTITENVDGKPGQIQLNNQSAGGKDKAWKWDYQIGRSTEENPVVVFADDDEVYSIELVIWNDVGCYDTTRQLYEFYFDNLFVPNAFSPTSLVLGVRKFQPKGINLSDYHVMVFNKWGHMVWESRELDPDGRPAEGWDGTFEGELLPQDVYVWKIMATFKNGTVWEGSDPGNGVVSTAGTVTLIR